jgi:hypothetical protein
MTRPFLKQRVFISYNREPRENLQFAHELAGALRGAGFDPWLDEEQIPGGAAIEHEIRQAIATAQHAIFIVTKRWLERPYTRLELNLFDRHPPATHCRVAVRREDLDMQDLAPQLQMLNIISWLPDEPQPEARLWQVYCALRQQAPGPKAQWLEKGRALITGSDRPSPPAPPPTAPPAPAPRPAAQPATEGPAAADWVPCSSRPVLALPARQSTFVMTERGEWFRWDLADETGLERLPDLPDCSAATVDPNGTVVASLYSSMSAWFRGGAWEFHYLDAPVLSLAATPHGVAAGDSAGTVTLFRGAGGRLKDVPLGEPVVELCPYDQGLAALGARGALARLEWTEDGARMFEPVALPADFDRPVGLFGGGPAGRFGIFAADRVAVCDAGSGCVSAGGRAFPEGVRAAVFLGRGAASYGVLTDTGKLYLHDADLNTPRVIPLPGDTPEVAGVCRGAAGGLLAWTAGGSLFLVSRERTVRPLPAEDVVLAHPDPEHPHQVLVVRWNRDKGVQVREIQSDTAR